MSNLRGKNIRFLILSKTSHKTKVQLKSGFRQDINGNSLVWKAENDANAKVDGDVLMHL